MATKNRLVSPINFIYLISFSICATAPSSSNAEKLKQAYLDDKQNVHVLTAHGHHAQVTNKKNSTELKIAPDNETVAWLVMNNWTAEGDIRPGSEELAIYRNGKADSIKCRPFIRDYWFWNNGSQVAIDCGGRHFAGREILYDTKTLKEISRFNQNDIPMEKTSRLVEPRQLTSLN
jgi:hypothetical protein